MRKCSVCGSYRNCRSVSCRSADICWRCLSKVRIPILAAVGMILVVPSVAICMLTDLSRSSAAFMLLACIIYLLFMAFSFTPPFIRWVYDYLRRKKQ